MNILILKMKHGDLYIDASDKGKAFLKAFSIFKDEGYYDYDPGDDKDLIDKASAGNAKAAERLLLSRSRCEYEGVEMERLIDPNE